MHQHVHSVQYIVLGLVFDADGTCLYAEPTCAICVICLDSFLQAKTMSNNRYLAAGLRSVLMLLHLTAAADAAASHFPMSTQSVNIFGLYCSRKGVKNTNFMAQFLVVLGSTDQEVKTSRTVK